MQRIFDAAHFDAAHRDAALLMRRFDERAARTQGGAPFSVTFFWLS
jgi:hypothetical protein